MTTQDVVTIYLLLATRGIKVWVDGGFCIDALVGHATREHSDLDIAVERRDADALCTHAWRPNGCFASRPHTHPRRKTSPM